MRVRCIVDAPPEVTTLRRQSSVQRAVSSEHCVLSTLLLARDRGWGCDVCAWIRGNWNELGVSDSRATALVAYGYAPYASANDRYSVTYTRGRAQVTSATVCRSGLGVCGPPSRLAPRPSRRPELGPVSRRDCRLTWASL
eukprot:1015959-Prymnesium_polylepis.2